MSGYSEGFRSKIIAEGLSGYLNTIRKRIKSGFPINRPKEMISMQSKKRTITAANWYNSGLSTYDSVLFVPFTLNGASAKLLQYHEAQNIQGRTSRIRIVEKAGRSIKNVLAPNYPWSIEPCKDPECFPCSTADGPPQISCRTPGVLYNIVCRLCEHTGNSSVYYGESGKNCYARGKKHIEDFKARTSSHCMVIHAKVHHPDEPWLVSNFRMIARRAFKRPLERQISEALEIANSNADVVLNSGSEWRSGRIPRASVSTD